MFVKKISVTDGIETFCYFYIDEKSSHGWLIDPGAEAEKIKKIIAENDWKIDCILLTHGHFDHIGAVEELSRELQIPYKAYRSEEQFLSNPQFNLSAYFNRQIILNDAEYLADGDVLQLSSDSKRRLQVIHTPGHTPDGVIFYDKDAHLAFVGDTIFKNSYGNTQFPGGDEKILMDSIKNKIFALPDDTILYSGHSEETTVGAEKQRLYYR